MTQPTDLPSVFKAEVDAFCLAMKSYYPEIKGYHGVDVTRFRSLCVENQKQALSDVQKYTSIYSYALRERIENADEKKLLWLALSKWGYRPTDDLFDTIENGDYIEVYNSDNVQVHRSFNYFALSSYSMDEIFSIPWFELYDRDPHRESEIVNVVSSIFSGLQTETIHAKITKHFLRERFCEQRVYDVSHNYFSPLKDTLGQQTAFVAISKARLATLEEFRLSRSH